ncbi:SDR family oxidoreductase [Siccirubricoccus phaeus]|uniref:SDR family oxidoreductase n=1 Tax=Siccirubricoccus phaeus TaxID=2595053 RepID=UPI0011F2E7A8|nr:SDR family oxidoreductase [Siccirubricoccus phaeus]
MKLQEQVAVITGGGSGIGRATALLFAREGAKLALVDRDAAAAEAVAAEIAALGGEAMTRCSDVGAPDAAAVDAAAILARFGRIDLLYAAAGFSVGGTVLTTAPEDWDAVFRVHVGGTWLWARAVIPAMQRQGGGAIITTSSQLAFAGGAGNSAYIAAKGAILGLTRTMALDFAADGIRVNAVVPGAIDTPLLRRSFERRPDPAAAMETSRNRHAMKRFGQAEEVAEAVLHLATAGFTTGTTLVVDGGWLAA